MLSWFNIAIMSNHEASSSAMKAISLPQAKDTEVHEGVVYWIRTYELL